MKKSGPGDAPAALRQDDRGFTLVELIVAIVILAIVFVPLLHSFVTSAQTELKSRQKNDAAMFAQTVIENIQATDAANLLAGYNAEKNEQGKETGVYTKDDTSGPSGYTAKITLTPVTAVNAKKVAVSNTMDAVIDMSGADADALNEFYSECNGKVDMAALQNALTRNVKISSVLQTNGTYQVSIVFQYGGTVSYNTTVQVDGKDVVTSNTVTLDYKSSDKAVLNAPTDAAVQTLKEKGGAAYSLYLYFAPILHEDAKTYYKDTFTITNAATGVSPNGLDFNVFLIDTSTHENNVNYVPDITYAGQNDLTRARVFSNVRMTNATAFLRSYTAYKNVNQTSSPENISIDGTLVEKQAQNRMYSVDVEVSRAGKTLAAMSAVKLG